MQADIEPRNLIGCKALDSRGSKIGTVHEVYLDDATGEPEWAAVRTGLLRRAAFVPLAPSEVVDDVLRVPYEKDLVRSVPDLGVGRHLSPRQEMLLYHFYGLDMPSPAEDPVSPPSPDVDFGRIAGSPGAGAAEG